MSFQDKQWGRSRNWFWWLLSYISRVILDCLVWKPLWNNVSVFCGVLVKGRTLSVCGLLLRALRGLTWDENRAAFHQEALLRCIVVWWDARTATAYDLKGKKTGDPSFKWNPHRFGSPKLAGDQIIWIIYHLSPLKNIRVHFMGIHLFPSYSSKLSLISCRNAWIFCSLKPTP